MEGAGAVLSFIKGQAGDTFHPVPGFLNLKQKQKQKQNSSLKIYPFVSPTWNAPCIFD